MHEKPIHSAALKIPELFEGVESPYTPVELLALDEPTYEIYTDDQGLDVSRIMYDLYTGEQTFGNLNRFLEFFGLNGSVFDELANPRGIFLEKSKSPKGQRAQMRDALLFLLGTNSELRTNFFRTDCNLKGFSNVFIQRLEETRKVRKEFPLTHPEFFPHVQTWLQQIEAHADMSPLEFFAKNKIPPLRTEARAATVQQFGLDTLLPFIVLAVTGKYTRTELPEQLWRLNINQSLISSWLINSDSPLSEQAKVFLQKRIPSSSA